jgi:hypothetical protein
MEDKPFRDNDYSVLDKQPATKADSRSEAKMRAVSDFNDPERTRIMRIMKDPTGDALPTKEPGYNSPQSDGMKPQGGTVRKNAPPM